MWILVVYTVNIIVGETVVIGLGLYLDRAYPPASLPISLSLFFIVFWFGWFLAVRWTSPEPGEERKVAHRSGKA